MTPTPYLTLMEAAEYLRMETLSRPTEYVWRYMRSGRLKFVRRGRIYLTTSEWCDDFLRMHRRRS